MNGVRCQKKDSDYELLIFGAIGQDWFGDGITDAMVAEALATIPKNVKSLTVRINSPGGDAFHGLAIYNLLHQSPLSINAVVDGLAASAASVIMMAGDTRQMAANSLLMIHRSWGGTIGNTMDHVKTAEVLAKLDESLAITYAARTGEKEDVIMNMMTEETWMDPGEAKKMGFTDSIIAAKEEDVAAFADQELFAKFAAHYKHPPKIEPMTFSGSIIDPTLVIPMSVRLTPSADYLKRRLDLLKVSA